MHDLGENDYKTGDVIGDYVLRERLSKGGYGFVFKAFNSKSRENVVIKILPKLLPESEKIYEDEVTAFKALGGLQGVLRLKDNGEGNNEYFVVTEFIQEGSLRNIFIKNPDGLEIKEVLQIFTPIADAIDRIHGRKIIHRDIKPENVLLNRVGTDYQIFIADFGVSKLVDVSGSYKTERLNGTPSYFAPEVWDTQAVKTSAVDIYAFGLMLYEAIEGKYPFDNLFAAQTEPLPYPEKTKQRGNTNVVEVLINTLSKDPNERPRSAGEIIDRIQNAYYDGSNEEDQKWLGRRIKNYTVKKVLARGKMGVAMCVDDDNGGHFVLKAFESNYMSGNLKKIYEKEVENLRGIENGHGVLTPREYFSHGGVFYIATDYQPGGSLRKMFNENHREMSVEKILDIFTQIAEAIDYIHRKKIIHRDVKPENIVCRQDGEKIIAYLTDFGIAEILAGTKSSFYTQTAAGTFYYMAPEAWNPKARKTRAMDIYSFGIMLYEAFEGHVPFEAGYPAIMNQHVVDQAPQPKKIIRKLGIDAKNIIFEALAKNPEDRPKSAVEIIQKINAQYLKTAGEKLRQRQKNILENASQIQTTSKMGVVVEGVEKSIKPLAAFDKKNLIIAILITIIVCGSTWMGLYFYGLYSPHETEMRVTVSATVPVTEFPSPPVTEFPSPPVTEFPSPPVTIIPSPEISCDLPKIDSFDLLPPYTARSTMLLRDVYVEKYGSDPDSYDLYAIAYYNNRKILEEQRILDGHTEYHVINSTNLDIKKGWKIFLPPQLWIEKYKAFPRTIPQFVQTNSQSPINISGSSVLFPLSSQISKCFAKITGVQSTYADSVGNTESGLRDFCENKVELFGANKEVTPEMLAQNGCVGVELKKFEVARYAMVIVINKNNPYANYLQKLTNEELTKLITPSSDPDDILTKHFPQLKSSEAETIKDKFFPNGFTFNPLDWEGFDDEKTIVAHVLAEQYAIGIVSYSFYNNYENKTQLELIPVEGFKANQETLAGEDPKYPLVSTLYLYTGKTTYENNPVIQNFINYYLSYEFDFIDDLEYLYPSENGYLRSLEAPPQP